MKMVCHAHANKTHFHKKGFALSFWTRDWLNDRDVLTSLRGRSKKGNWRGGCNINVGTMLQPFKTMCCVALKLVVGMVSLLGTRLKYL